MAIQSLKQAVSRRTKDAPKPFWQSRYHDSNLFTSEDFVRALQYIHRNPSKRGLCEKPEDWPWSSFWHYANGEERTVEIESEWTAQRRERMNSVEQPHPSKGS